MPPGRRRSRRGSPTTLTFALTAIYWSAIVPAISQLLQKALRQGGQQFCRGSIIAKGLADVRKAVYIPRAKYEAPTQLKRVAPCFVLAVPGGSGTTTGNGIVPSQYMKQIRAIQRCSLVGLAMLVNKKGKIDSRLLTECLRISAVAEPNRSQSATFVPDFLFVAAQLCDVLPAEDSAVVTQKDNHCRLF